MKGYWMILATEVLDQEAHVEYNRLWKPIAERYGARLKTPQTPLDLREKRNTGRVLLVEFPSLDAARSCHEDPAYQEAMTFAARASHRDLVIFEGDIA